MKLPIHRYNQLNDLIQLKKKYEFDDNDPVNEALCEAIYFSAKQLNSYKHFKNSPNFSLINCKSKANIL